ncbi:MAG: tyrosine-type recombinase/integrase [Candidatus Bathyarchaeota archaeon]|nr:tyrosine-type recombinase/integrase [Candidatus Bathyarchaeota archaeon]
MASTKGDETNANGGEVARVSCPKCQSEKVWRDGKRRSGRGYSQRFICRTCGLRFDGSTVFSLPSEENGNRQVCDQLDGSKNLIVANEEQWATGDNSEKTKQLIELETWLKKKGIKKTTIESKMKLLTQLHRRGADLDDPESVKLTIAEQKWCDGRKRNAVHAYSSLLKMKCLKWEAPNYQSIAKIPWIPQEAEVDQLIAGCNDRVATFLQLLKETGMRPGEAWNLKWTDIDTEANCVIVTPEKGSNSRRLKVSSKLVSMLNKLTKKNGYAFGNGIQNHFADCFRKQRKRIAYKLENPRLNQISFKTLRHFKATSEYRKTRDIYHVKIMLGHKMIKNTEIYTHIVEFADDDFVSKIANTAEEAKNLIESGFDYVCTTPESYMLFRKRK